MSKKVNPIRHNDQQPEGGSVPAQEFLVDKRELTVDEMIDAAAARILGKYREAFLELAK